VVGVVSSKLNALALAEKTGDLAQNVNFGLKSDALEAFLKAQDIGYFVRSVDLNRVLRSYEIFQQVSPSVFAVVARKSADPKEADHVHEVVGKFYAD
jgi:hypothetical protein